MPPWATEIKNWRADSVVLHHPDSLAVLQNDLEIFRIQTDAHISCSTRQLCTNELPNLSFHSRPPSTGAIGQSREPELDHSNNPLRDRDSDQDRLAERAGIRSGHTNTTEHSPATSRRTKAAHSHSLALTLTLTR